MELSFSFVLTEDCTAVPAFPQNSVEKASKSGAARQSDFFIMAID
jgi:hypothetical protein